MEFVEGGDDEPVTLFGGGVAEWDVEPVRVFRFTIFWEKAIVILVAEWAVGYRDNLGGSGQGHVNRCPPAGARVIKRGIGRGERVGVGNGVVGSAGRASWPRPGPRELDRGTVIELGSLAQGVGDQIVGNLEFMENRGFWCHRRAIIVGAWGVRCPLGGVFPGDPEVGPGRVAVRGLGRQARV
jgi:hypothetical protein